MVKVSRAKVYNEGGHILNPGDIVAVKYVTVIGYAEDFAVYMGLSGQSDQDVADHGDKVGEDVARTVAPYCSHLRYRR
jgi:hypothetical protein